MPRKRFWDIWGELEDWGRSLRNRCLEPLCYIEDRGGHFLVSADLPFVEKENIDVSLTGDLLEINARMKTSYRFSRLGVVQREIEFESFHKILRLPSGVDIEKAKARFRNGVLEIELPKKIQKKSIEID